MSISPLITFKAGLCEYDETSKKVQPQSTPGYIYLYSEDEEFIHFCWRPRSAPLDEPDLDLIMFPGDGSFVPYQNGAVNGRIFVLKFSSSSQRNLFWLQSKTQHPNGDVKHFSERDLRLGKIVDNLLQGEDVDVQGDAPGTGNLDGGDDDATMEDAEGVNPHAQSKGGAGTGAGANATGGDVRSEGQASRGGGASGGRAASSNTDVSSIVQNFINSIGGGAPQQPVEQKLFTTLQDLLTSATTIPWIDGVPETQLDLLLQFLPSSLTTLTSQDDTSAATATTLSTNAKRDLIRKVLRSPQFAQNLASLTFALRDGGLPIISESLNVPVQNGGYLRHGGVAIGGGEAIEVFVRGVRDQIEKEGKEDDMDTS